MLKNSIWITGSTRSGKTTQLVAQFQQWLAQGLVPATSRRFVSPSRRRSLMTPAILVFAANDDNRRDLAQQITTAIQGRYPVLAKTP